MHHPVSYLTATSDLEECAYIRNVVLRQTDIDVVAMQYTRKSVEVISSLLV